MALRHSGRGAGDQESERQADQSRQGPEGDRADCPDRDAGREPPRRPVVDLRFHQSGAAGIGEAVRALCQGPGRTRAQSLWSAARAGAALHPASHEDRQIHHRRPARQDRDQGLLRSQPQAGGALRAGGRGTRRSARASRRHPAQGHRAGDADAPQADLQPSVAVAGRRRVGRGGQRQTGAPARDRRSGGRAAGEDAGLHASSAR